METTDNRSKEG